MEHILLLHNLVDKNHISKIKYINQKTFRYHTRRHLIASRCHLVTIDTLVPAAANRKKKSGASHKILTRNGKVSFRGRQFK